MLLVLLLFCPFEGFSEEDGFEKGLVLIKARQYDEAVEAFSGSAAYAANGQFDEAIASQKKVIELMIQQNRTDGLDPYIDNLLNYKAHKPLRISYATQNAPDPVMDVKVNKPLKADVKPKKPTATPPELSSGNLGPLPYTIQVSAYRDPQKSLDAATKLKNNGDPAFTCPVLIPGQGEWHRVFVGFYQSLDEARKAAGRLKKRKFNYVQVAEKPFAVQVGLGQGFRIE